MAALREREAALLTAQSIEEDLGKRQAAAAALDEAGARRCGASCCPDSCLGAALCPEPGGAQQCMSLASGRSQHLSSRAQAEAPPQPSAWAVQPPRLPPPICLASPRLAPCLVGRVGGDAAKARKVAALQNEVAALQAAHEAAQQEYERVRGRNLQVRAPACLPARNCASGKGRASLGLDGQARGRRWQARARKHRGRQGGACSRPCCRRCLMYGMMLLSESCPAQQLT